MRSLHFRLCDGAARLDAENDEICSVVEQYCIQPAQMNSIEPAQGPFAKPMPDLRFETLGGQAFGEFKGVQVPFAVFPSDRISAPGRIRRSWKLLPRTI